MCRMFDYSLIGALALVSLAACSQTGDDDDDKGNPAIAGQMGLPATAGGTGGIGAGMNPPPPATGGNMAMTPPLGSAAGSSAPITQGGSGGSTAPDMMLGMTMPPAAGSGDEEMPMMMEPACD